jgi:hypothetical protein
MYKYVYLHVCTYLYTYAYGYYINNKLCCSEKSPKRYTIYNLATLTCSKIPIFDQRTCLLVLSFHYSYTKVSFI